MATLAERITELRLAANLKQTDLADILGVSKYSVSGWERGVRKPDFNKLEEICSFFNVTMSYLLGEKDDATPPGVPTDAELAEWAEDDEIESLRYIARMLTCLSNKSFRIAASTIRSAYMSDKEDDALTIGYDVKVSRFQIGDAGELDDESADVHTGEEADEVAEDDPATESQSEAEGITYQLGDEGATVTVHDKGATIKVGQYSIETGNKKRVHNSKVTVKRRVRISSKK